MIIDKKKIVDLNLNDFFYTFNIPLMYFSKTTLH
jgi:hypothetical protein